MREGIEGRLFHNSAERCDRSIRGKKRDDISDLSPVESKWINPSYRNHSSWLHPSNVKLHYTGTTAAQCVPPASSPAFVSSTACIILDENIICLLSVFLSHTNPNPQKWQLSYAGIMLPSPTLIQPRKINYKRLGLASFCWRYTWEMGWKKWQEEESVQGKKQRRDNIVKRPSMTAEHRGRESI